MEQIFEELTNLWVRGECMLGEEGREDGTEKASKSFFAEDMLIYCQL